MLKQDKTINHNLSSNQARARVAGAVRSGKLSKPPACELCDRSHPRVVAHHWTGYDHPLDVWWVCPSCNHILSGWHDGVLSKARAREQVRDWYGRQYLKGRNPERLRRETAAAQMRVIGGALNE